MTRCVKSGHEKGSTWLPYSIECMSEACLRVILPSPIRMLLVCIPHMVRIRISGTSPRHQVHPSDMRHRRVRLRHTQGMTYSHHYSLRIPSVCLRADEQRLICVAHVCQSRNPRMCVCVSWHHVLFYGLIDQVESP